MGPSSELAGNINTNFKIARYNNTIVLLLLFILLLQNSKKFIYKKQGVTRIIFAGSWNSGQATSLYRFSFDMG